MAASRKVSRRGFLESSASLGALSAGLHVVKPHVLGAEGKAPPSDTVLVGGIGVGRQGRGILSAGRGSKVIAVADVYQKHLYEVAKSRGGCDTYEDYRKMLERADLDAVTVGTPDHWHVPCCLHAVEAGKDVYCEKPLSLTIAEGRVLVEAVRRYNRVFQTGSMQRSSFHCRTGCELVRNGRAGKIHTVHGACYPSPWYPVGLAEEPVPEGLDWEMWLGPAPVHPYNVNIQRPRAKPGWISFRPFSGGEMTGWGSHGLDIIQWGLGADETGPVEVWADSADLRSQVHYRYASGVMLHLDRGPQGGGIFVGDQGEIMVTRGAFACKPKEIGEPPLTASDFHLYFSNHHGENWGECIRTRRRPICDIEIGHRSCTVCHLGNIARWLAPRKLKWDPDKECFPDDAEANRYLDRPRREPYRL
ncbi:MAG TPA: Gfo/Idh/MocA family oxidoreductase [Planctomycetota bacterium]|nr:Gfo/Idh/MocA family oxidoreductase [Planctomycetota bacterium]